MAVKLTDAQTRTLTEVNGTGKLPKGTREATVAKLRENGFLVVSRIGDEVTYTLTGEGLDAIGVVRPEIITEPHVKLPDFPAERPFVVQQLSGDVWKRIGREAATWGTANVWRNRLAALGKTVRVHNMITDQVWA